MTEISEFVRLCMFGDNGPDMRDPVMRSYAEFVDPESLRSRTVSGELKSWGAFYLGKLVGVISVKNMNHISLYYVAPSLCGIGIGSALYDTYIRQAISAKVHHITLNATRAGRPIYEHFGFRTDESVIPQSPSTTPMHTYI